MGDFKFISLIGLKNEQITINLNYLIKFEPMPHDRTRIYLDNRSGVVSYGITLSYTELIKLIKGA